MAVEIIAECGINHNGSLKTALSMVDAAIYSGANYVKWQCWFRTDFAHVPFTPWTKDKWKDLFWWCKRQKMPWFATPFDLEAISFLKECGMKIWKVPSGMLVNRPYLEAIRDAAGDDRVIVSTGMATDEEVDEAIEILGTGQLLYCVSLYPAMPAEINLNNYRITSGFSDHSEGDELAIAAVARGAEVIEKHFTLDRDQPGPDHKASLDPAQFAEMVRRIRNVEQALIPKPMSEREYAQRDTIRKRMAFQ